MPLGTAFETLFVLSYNSSINTEWELLVLVSTALRMGGYYIAFDSHARDMYHNTRAERTCVLLKIPSMHTLV